MVVALPLVLRRITKDTGKSLLSFLPHQAILIIHDRFLHMTHESAAGNRTIIYADPSSANNFIAAEVPARQLNTEIMDVAFVSTTGGYPGGEEALRKGHRFASPVPLGQHWAYKYLLDLDGMGYSGRFLALLSSESAVVKSTVWQEFLTDWLQPWYVLYWYSDAGLNDKQGYTIYRYPRLTRRYTIYMRISQDRHPQLWQPQI